LQQFELVGTECYVHPETHVFDILRIANENKLQIVAVLNEDNTYLGLITVQDVMTSFAQSAMVQMPGGILVLSMDLIDYSLAQIARYVEENNAKIISSMLVEDMMDKGKIKLTLKINQEDLSRIVATLERFGYRVIGRYQENRENNGTDKDRIDMLMRYLNI